MQNLSSLKTRLSVSAAALLSALMLTACGSSNGSSSSTPTSPPPTAPTPPPPTPTGTSFTLNGATTKGLILGGTVIVTDAANAGTTLVTGQTSTADGNFDLNIPASANFNGPFVKVTVTGDSDALMVCDAGDGCVDSAGMAFAFGETFAVPASVSLSAIVPTPAENATETVNINIFSDLAASLAEASTTLSGETLTVSNAQVANLFGLSDTDMTKIAVTDITTAAAAATDPNALRAGVLSGGVLSAAFESGNDIGAALERLRTDFSANDGQLVLNEASDDTMLISLEDILNGASDAAGATALSTVEFQRVKAEILGESVAVNGNIVGMRTTAAPAPSVMEAPLDQAKAMVADVQLLVSAVQSDANGDSLTAFADRVEVAAQLIETESGNALDAAITAFEAMVSAYEAFDEDETTTTHSAFGLTVDVASEGDVLTLSLASQSLGDETVEMVYRGSLDVEVTETSSDTEMSFEERVVVTFGGDGELTGVVENDGVSLKVVGANVSVTGGSADSFNQSSTAETVLDTDENGGRSVVRVTEGAEGLILVSERVSADIEVLIEQKTDDGLAFEGLVFASALGPRYDDQTTKFAEEIEDTRNFNSRFERDGVSLVDRSATVQNANFGFTGKLSEGGESVTVSFGVDFDGENLRLAEKAEIETVVFHPIENNSINIVLPTRNFEYRFVDADEYQSYLDTISQLEGYFTIDREEGDILHLIPGDALAITNVIDLEKPIFRYTDTDTMTGEVGLEIFLQAETAQTIVSRSEDRSEEFLANPPTDIVEFYNQGWVVTDQKFVYCNTDLGGYFFRTSNFIDPSRDGFPDIALNERFYGSQCNTGDNYLNFSSDAEAEFDPDFALSAIIAGSVEQNIAGIDPEDTNVKASIFGPIAYSDDEVSGDLTLKVEFAGRTFLTDARSLDIFDDLSEPVLIRNQDGVVFEIAEDENGLATGSVSKDGVEHGVITEENGIVLVTYTDNSFVSLQ